MIIQYDQTYNEETNSSKQKEIEKGSESQDQSKNDASSNHSLVLRKIQTMRQEHKHYFLDYKLFIQKERQGNIDM